MSWFRLTGRMRRVEMLGCTGETHQCSKDKVAEMIITELQQRSFRRNSHQGHETERKFSVCLSCAEKNRLKIAIHIEASGEYRSLQSFQKRI